MYRALIVEDEALMRGYLAAKLTEICPAWEAAATAADGMEAVERLAHERFDAIITDIRMPGMDGLELARYIRRTDEKLPILIVSGYDTFDYARVAMRLNVSDYLLKPLNEAELGAALTAMATQVAARKAVEGGWYAALLAGDPGANTELHTAYPNQHFGLLLLAPAHSADEGARAEAALRLRAEAEKRFAPLCAPWKEGVAVLCPARDPLLVDTECRNTAQRFLNALPSLAARCAYAPFDPAQPKAALAKTEVALRLALALNTPMLSDRLSYEQRQALARLDAMLAELNAAVALDALPDERRATLLAALAEFPPAAQPGVALALLCECDATGSARALALRAMQEGGAGEAQSAFSQALTGLVTLAQGAEKPASALVERAREFLQLHFAEPLSLTALADRLGITSAYLSALFHREMGLSYSQYLLQLRMEDAARRLLCDPGAKIQAVGEAVGFPSPKHFTHVFGQYYRLSPREYRERKGGGHP